VKHTRGPWIVVGDRQSGFGICNKEEPIVWRKGGICEEENALLIAAAPDLLKTLKKVVRISDRDHKAWNAAKAAAPDLLKTLKKVVRISDRDHKAWNAAKAAIAKAEGRP
jgi:hypothetical protein